MAKAHSTGRQIASQRAEQSSPISQPPTISIPSSGVLKSMIQVSRSRSPQIATAVRPTTINSAPQLSRIQIAGRTPESRWKPARAANIAKRINDYQTRTPEDERQNDLLGSASGRQPRRPGAAQLFSTAFSFAALVDRRAVDGAEIAGAGDLQNASNRASAKGRSHQLRDREAQRGDLFSSGSAP